MTVAEPVVGESETTSVTDATVDDYCAHVRTRCSAVERGPIDRPEPSDMCTGCTQCVHEPRLHDRTRTERVQHHEYAHTCACALGEYVAHLPSDLAGLGVIHLHGDRLLRGREILPELWIRSVSVEAKCHFVARREVRARVELHYLSEERIANGRRTIRISRGDDCPDRSRVCDRQDTDYDHGEQHDYRGYFAGVFEKRSQFTVSLVLDRLLLAWKSYPVLSFTYRSTGEIGTTRPAGIVYSIGMHLAAAPRKMASKAVLLDRSLEVLPLFRLSDSAEEGAISYVPDGGGRWRVLPAPGDRLPGTFDQDVYVEIMHRFGEAGFPSDGTISFTLHAFLRSIGRKADGRTYEQVRASLNRLVRTRLTDRDQLALFSVISASEPGEARVVLAPQIRANIAAGNTISLSLQHYGSLTNPVARRLYRLLAAARSQDMVTWRISLERLASQLPLTQRYPSHLQRVLQPAHEMLIAAGLLRDAGFHQIGKDWHVDYVLATRNTIAP